MVRAILAGTKTQTRRLVKARALEWLGPDMFTPEYVADPANGLCPYGVPGDRLWVRETWMYVGPGSGSEIGMLFEGAQPENHKAENCWYRGDQSWDHGDPASLRWTPSIHMPRWASRLTLEVTDLRVQRLQDISEEDAEAEGADYRCDRCGDSGSIRTYGEGGVLIGEECPDCVDHSPRGDFRELWNSINAKRAPWDSNPWVWAITFRQVA
jgi:hypothetical protein